MPEDGEEWEPSEQWKRLASIYDAKLPKEFDEDFEFSKSFENQMPQDVGGHGSFRRWDTTLGSTSIYMERFRGTDDLLAHIDKQSEFVDELVDLAIDWFSHEP